jgi:hypothetical protein
MQGGFDLRQRHGSTFFGSVASCDGSSSLTFACFECAPLPGFDTGCSGDEPHPKPKQTITQTNERTAPSGTTTKTVGQPRSFERQQNASGRQ